MFAGGCGPSQGGPPGVASFGVGGKTAFPSVGEMEGQVTLNKTCLPVTGGCAMVPVRRAMKRPRRYRATLSGGVVS